MSEKTARRFILGMSLLTLGNWFYARNAKAAPQLVFGQPACRSFVPTEWGDDKGSS